MLSALLAFGAPADAAGPPTVLSTWAGEVTASSARLHTEVNPSGASTSYHFDYIATPAYEANVAAGKDGFSGGAKVPAGSDPTAGSGSQAIPLAQSLSGLQPGTSYRYRVAAKNASGAVTSTPFTVITQEIAGVTLLDGRGWEMVSPVEKNGGQVDSPGSIAGGGVFQAAAEGGKVTYGSSTSFASGAQGAPQGSQYVSTRGEAGWSTQNITAPALSGSYGSGPVGVPYQLFSSDLSSALMLNGRHCRGGAEGCGVQNPPLAGSGAPAGYQNYYLRMASGSFDALVKGGELANSSLDAGHFDLALAGASEDLSRVVLSTCAALTATAAEIPGGGTCNSAATNLYVWSAAGLSQVNTSPGATLAAPTGAVSADGSRIYFVQGGNLLLRDGAAVTQPDESAGGGGEFEAASTDGSLAYFTKGGHLWRYEATGDSATDLTPAGEVVGVLGASPDGAYVYYLTESGLFLRHGADTTEVATGATAVGTDDYPPATAATRVAVNGNLAFATAAPLTGYDNTDQRTGKRDPEVFLYDAGTGSLTCVSCNPANQRPVGPSSLPGTYANGTTSGSLQAYRPRALSSGGNRLFFDSSDALLPADTNGEPDAYEWEAQGSGSCAKAGGCLGLLSSGKASTPSVFVDAAADGSDAYFLTERSLVPTDPGSVDLYDAKVGGGFPAPFAAIPCDGDACQSLPSEPEDPAVTSLVPGPGNPAVRYPKHRSRHRAKSHHPAKKGKPAKKHGRGRQQGAQR
jgi:hypothetical protein